MSCLSSPVPIAGASMPGSCEPRTYSFDAQPKKTVKKPREKSKSAFFMVGRDLTQRVDGAPMPSLEAGGIRANRGRDFDYVSPFRLRLCDVGVWLFATRW